MSTLYSSFRQKFALHRTYRRIRKLWDDYRAVAELDDRTAVMERLNAFIDAFQSTYVEYEKTATTKGLQLEKVYGDCTDIFLALLDVVDKETSDPGDESHKDTAVVGEMVDRALSVAELILHDEKYRLAVQQTPNLMEKLLTLLDTLRSTETKMRALHLIASLSLYPGSRLEIGRLEGFRKMFRLFFEGNDNLKREILHTLQYFLVVRDEDASVDHVLRKLDNYAASAGAVAVGQTPEDLSEGSIGTIQFARLKFIDVAKELGRVFLPEIVAVVTQPSESVNEPESVEEVKESVYPPTSKSLALAAETLKTRLRRSGSQDATPVQVDMTEVEEGEWTQISVVVEGDEGIPDSLKGSLPPEEEEAIVKEFMRVQGALSTLTHSLKMAAGDVKLDAFQMISKLLARNPAGQDEFRRIDGYSLVLQAVDKPSYDSEALGHIFDIFLTISLDGNEEFMVGNIDAVVLLVRLCESSTQLPVRIRAALSLIDMISANPMNIVAIEEAGAPETILRIMAGDKDVDLRFNNTAEEKQSWFIAHRINQTSYPSWDRMETASETCPTNLPFLQTLQKLVEYMAVTLSLRDCKILLGLVQIMRLPTISITVLNTCLASICKLCSDALARGTGVPYEVLETAVDLIDSISTASDEHILDTTQTNVVLKALEILGLVVLGDPLCREIFLRRRSGLKLLSWLALVHVDGPEKHMSHFNGPENVSHVSLWLLQQIIAVDACTRIDGSSMSELIILLQLGYERYNESTRLFDSTSLALLLLLSPHDKKPTVLKNLKEAFNIGGGLSACLELIESDTPAVAERILLITIAAVIDCESSKCYVEDIVSYPKFYAIFESTLARIERRGLLERPCLLFELTLEIATMGTVFDHWYSDVPAPPAATVPLPSLLYTMPLPVESHVLRRSPEVATVSQTVTPATPALSTYMPRDSPWDGTIAIRTEIAGSALLSAVSQCVDKGAALRLLVLLVEMTPHNAGILCAAGGIKMCSTIIETADEETSDAAISLLTSLGAYSIEQGDVRLLFRMAHIAGSTHHSLHLRRPQLLYSIGRVADSSGPASFYFFNGVNCGLSLSGVDKFPTAKIGYVFSCWLRIRSFPSNIAPLLSFDSKGGPFCEIFFKKRNGSTDSRELAIRLRSPLSPPEQEDFSEAVFEAGGGWHFLAICHKKTSFSLFIDSRQVVQASITYPSKAFLQRPVTLRIGTACQVATEFDDSAMLDGYEVTRGFSTDTDADPTGAFCGEIGGIHFIEGTWDRHVVFRVASHGPLSDRALQNIGIDNREVISMSSVSVIPCPCRRDELTSPIVPQVHSPPSPAIVRSVSTTAIADTRLMSPVRLYSPQFDNEASSHEAAQAVGCVERHHTCKLKPIAASDGHLKWVVTFISSPDPDHRIPALRLLATLLHQCEDTKAAFELIGGYDLLLHVLNTESLTMEDFDVLFELAVEGIVDDAYDDENERVFRNERCIHTILYLATHCSPDLQIRVIRVLCGILNQSRPAMSVWRKQPMLGVQALIDVGCDVADDSRRLILEVIRRFLVTDATADEVEIIIDHCIVVGKLSNDLLRIILDCMTNLPKAGNTIAQLMMTSCGFLGAFGLLAGPRSLAVLGVQVVGCLLSASSKNTAAFHKVLGFETMGVLLQAAVPSLEICATVIHMATDEYHVPSSASRNNGSSPTNGFSDNTVLASTTVGSKESATPLIVHPLAIKVGMELLQQCEVGSRTSQQLQILQSIERLMDSDVNMDKLWESNWLEWAWMFVRIQQEEFINLADPASPVLELQLRSMVRRMLLYGLSQRSGVFEARIRDMIDAEKFQLMAIGDIADGFEEHSRIAECDAPIILKNFATLLRHVDELQGFSADHAIALVNAINALAISNTASIRALMSVEVFVIRESLLLSLLKGASPPSALDNPWTSMAFESIAAGSRFREGHGVLRLLRLMLVAEMHGRSLQIALCEALISAVIAHVDNKRTLDRCVGESQVMSRLISDGNQPTNNPRVRRASKASITGTSRLGTSLTFSEAFGPSSFKEQSVLETDEGDEEFPADDSFVEDDAVDFLDWLYDIENVSFLEQLRQRVTKLIAPIDAAYAKQTEKNRQRSERRSKQRLVSSDKAKSTQLKAVTDVQDKCNVMKQKLISEVKEREESDKDAKIKEAKDGETAWDQVKTWLEDEDSHISTGVCAYCEENLATKTQSLFHHYFHHDGL